MLSVPKILRWVPAGAAARHRTVPVLLLLALGSAGITIPVRGAAPFHVEKLREMDSTILEAIADGSCPGGVLWLERRDQVYHRAYGQRAIDPVREPMTEDTVFDVASLTKVVATTPAVLLLAERQKVRIDAPVRNYLPEFRGEGADSVTLRHLLTHTSGLRAGLSLQTNWAGYDQGIALACAERPQTNPGTIFRYSDINFILLGEVVRRVSGSALDSYAAREVFGPLGMTNTMFRPPASLRPRIAPTTRETNGLLRGVVHDPTARRMGGVAGHAGLFTTARDLARYAQMLLNEGELNGKRILRPESVRLMRAVQTAASVPVRRGLGWDLDSPYAGPRGDLFPLGSFGHTGWTGSAIWIDPFSKSFVFFLSNRNHPTENGSVSALRRRLGTLAAQAIPDFNFAYVPGALTPRPEPTNGVGSVSRRVPGSRVSNGIDVLVAERFQRLRGLRLGLVTNHTGHDRERRSTIDLLHRAEGVTLKALFSPEHGIRGILDESVGDSVDQPTGLTIHSLYGERRKPTPDQLRELDALVFDIQDIGCRFYTYISTMGLCLEAAAEAGLAVYVLDRVNPINGVAVEGPVHSGPSQFVAFHRLPLRHGMTVGELARMFVAERALKVELTVVPLEGWRRELWLDETGLPWTNPSPNMRSLTEATLYPGVGLLERALSVGRGTDTPFEVVGAPYANDVELAAELNRSGIEGARFIPIRFIPGASTFNGQACGGVRILVTDRNALKPVELGLTLIRVFHRLYAEAFAIDDVNPLLLRDTTLDGVRRGQTTADLQREWSSDLEDFRRRREKFLLYQ